MTEPSITPTQRAAAISVHCPVGWRVRAHGPGFAIYSSGLSDWPPHSLMHGDDMAVLTAIWGWHTSELDQTLRALKDLASRLGCAVADSLPGFFERQTTGFSKRVLALVHRALGRDQLAEDPAATPIRAYDAVAELAQEHAAVRKKWSGSASERDEFWKVLRALGLGDAETLADFTARWLGCAHALAVAEKHIATTEREGVRNGEEQLRLHAAVEAAEKLVTKREADIFDLRSEVEALKKAAEVAPIDRDMLSDALDCARREVVWVPESSRAVLDEQLDNSLLAYGFASSDIAKMSAAQKADEISKAQQRAAGVTAVPATTTRQTDEAGESEQVRNAIEWCTTHAGRGLAAELAQDAARKLQASLATMTGRPTLRWAIAQALHIGAEAAIEWAERYWGGKLEAQQVELRQLREDQTDYQALLELQRARRDLSIYEADSCGVAELAATAIAKFSKLPMAIEARSYDIKRRAKIAVRIEPDTAKPRVVGNPVPRPSPAARIAEQIKADLNKPAAKPGRNVMDEVLGLGEATERFDRAATDAAPRKGFRTALDQLVAGGEAMVGTRVGATRVNVSGVEVQWTGSAWVPTRLVIDGDESIAVSGVDGPVPVRAAGWTGITWMSGKGRAKSLTLPGLHVRADLGPNALRSAKMESLSQKAIKVLQRRDRLYAFHLPGGVKRYGYVDTWSHLRAGEPLAISIRPPKVKAEAPKPVRQGIAWRRPGHDVDSFAELPIRPTFDEGGNQVIEVHAELPEDLRHEIKQTSRDRPTITVTTANGATLKGPIAAWMRQNGPDGVLWRLTMPQRVPLPT